MMPGRRRLHWSPSWLLLRLAGQLVPPSKRVEWLERWDAELLAVASEDQLTNRTKLTRWRLACGAIVDAIFELTVACRNRKPAHGVRSDLRQAWRQLMRDPASTAISILIIGIGGTAAASIFALADATLLRTPPAIRDPESLVQIGRGTAQDFDNYSYLNFQDLRDRLVNRIDLAAFANGSVVVGRGPHAAVVQVQYVTASYFAVIGIPISGGSGSLHDHGAPTAIVSAHFWRDRSSEILAAGGSLIVNGQPVRVSGIAPAGFIGTYVGRTPPVMWLSLPAADGAARRLRDRGNSWLWVIGRRSSDVSVEAARAFVADVRRDVVESGNATIGDAVTVTEGVGLRPDERIEANKLVALLLGGSAIVLVIATANVASLQLTRVLAGTRASAVRIALGASRARLVRTLLLEQGVTAVLGGAVSWTGAFLVTPMVRASLPYELAVTFRPDIRVLISVVAAAVIVSTVICIVPLWRASKVDAIGELKRDGRSGIVRTWGRSTLVFCQISLASALIVSGGFLLASLVAAGAAKPGFDAKGVTLAVLRRQPNSRPLSVIRRDLRASARALTGVEHVGLATHLPLIGSQVTRSVAPLPTNEGSHPVPLVATGVDSGFFQVLRIPVLHGPSPPLAETTAGEIPVVMTKAAQTRLWASPVGDRRASMAGHTLRLEATVGDMRVRSLRNAFTAAMFLPLERLDEMPTYLLVRTSVSQADTIRGLRTALAPLANDIVLMRVEAMPSLVAASLSETTLAARLAIPLAALSIVLAGIGLYGLLSRSVLERQREFGVRLALGARPEALRRGILQRAVVTALGGLFVGVSLFLLCSSIVRQWLFGVELSNPFVVGGTALVVLAMSMFAAAAPAWRASRTDPMVILRVD